MFFKIDVLKNFVNFTGKHLCWKFGFNKIAGIRPATLLKDTPTRVFFCKICKILKYLFYRIPPVIASV